MRVICPHCGYDAGDIPEVEKGSKLECECGYRWISQGEMLSQDYVRRATPTEVVQFAKSAVQVVAGCAGSAVSTGLRRMRDHIARRQFLGRLPEFFLDVASDGIITEDEVNQLRFKLDEFGIHWNDAVAQIKPLCADFIRRVLADAVADCQVTTAEREELDRYIRVFSCEDMLEEVQSVLDRVETIWKLNNGVLPVPLTHKPLWLRSDEGLYFFANAVYQQTRKDRVQLVMGEMFLTNTRFEFVAPGLSVSHMHEHLRLCEPTRRTQLVLHFHPRKGSGTYQVPDAPVAAAYVNALVRAANRTISICREDSTHEARRRISQEVRHEVWIRDSGRCVQCGAEDYLEFDHLIPVAKGGSNGAGNIQLLCRRCNGKKSDHI